MRDHRLSPDEPQIGDLGEFRNNDCENVNKTGTTTVGIAVEEGVVIATDRRASLGGRFVSSKSVVKVEEIHPTAAMTLVGSVGGAQQFIKHVRTEASLYHSRRGSPMKVRALATYASNLARRGPFFAINPILGGVDEEGSHVYTIDPHGGVMEDDYAVTGSGMQLAYGVLEENYDESLSMEEAEEVAVTAVKTAAERDTGSGNGVVTAVITDEDVSITEFDSYEDFEEENTDTR